MEKRERPTETAWSKLPCRKRRKQLDEDDDEEIPYIPQDIIFDVFLRCPPDFLYDSARFVCKTWYNLIRNPRFTRDHLLRHVHPPDHAVGLLFVKNPRARISRFLEISEGNIKLTDFIHQFPAQILPTSYGVALYYRIENIAESLYVVNPVTKQVVKLPRPDFKRLRFYFRWSCISYLPGTEEIKVVTRVKDMGEQYHWYILTVGRKMSWRKIVSTVNPEGITIRGFVSDGMPTCVGGVVYWKFEGKIVAIDLSDEIIHYFYLPMTLKSQGRLLEMGNHLCMIEITRTSVLRPENVWIMEGLKQKEWAIIYKLEVNFELKNAGILFPRPIGWLENQQMLLFEEYVRGTPSSEVVPVIVAYDVRTGTRTSYMRRSLYLSLDDIVVVHSSSLISW
ncbi:F-box/kelch-repeat protein At4g19930-like [Carya illinoinensis]|uniref:F-box domain-containing protein n=1 Tax=Carya illinoinensis TaxID=32201 RepID=A0A8T1QP21_CARIL|nr:F-box/kelch-repeat protein At4g19930-like [Carya illinoinensis]KAG6655732.1 hypothetical protein CIPAW_05G236300 [Carya illinoinensis]